jgi:AraC-like DNA-binding protein
VPAHFERFQGLFAGFHVEWDDRTTGLLHGGENWASPSYVIGEHAHDGWEIYLQADGVTRWRVAGEVVELRAGELLAVPPATVHAMADPAARRHHYYYAGIDVDVVDGRHRGLGDAWRGATMLRATDGRPAEAPFRRLVREIGHNLPMQHLGVATAVDALLVEVTRVVHTPGGRPVLEAVHPAVGRARRLLDERYAEPWTVPALARDVGLSTAHLAELFAREVGVPPYRYLVERRVERAAELLGSTDLPITAIAHELGFASSSHFSRVFRELSRVTPRAYRRAAQGSA